MEIILNPDDAPDQQEAAAGGDLIKESDTANFNADVIEMSSRVPVIVDFWAPWCGPCKQLGPLLEKLVRHAAGLVRLVKINIDENQELAQQLRIQSIPTVFAFKDGRPVDAFMGALPESELRQFIGRLTGGTKAPIDVALEEAAAALDGGNVDGASQLYRHILSQEPDNAGATGGLLRCAMASDDVDGAKRIIEGLTDELKAAPEIAAVISALELVEESGNSGDVAEFEARLARDANDPEARFDLAVALYGTGQSEAAIDQLVELVRRDRQWNDEAARKRLVKIFEALGPSDPLTVSGRKRLSLILFS